ncbi:hypothetical protein SAMN05421630_11248 [Prauserella marina]|uniref:Uncharacterized protein n=1 Tax=Prauserella marina TaxID=530584 RepID=A0A1G6XE46_9PSEU|nr:hypothetical protein DES30_110190 [Prauserella marina]SDD76479.1 hypothetical protein SAMN05421630_11248 [Prauserella marina]
MASGVGPGAEFRPCDASGNLLRAHPAECGLLVVRLPRRGRSGRGRSARGVLARPMRSPVKIHAPSFCIASCIQDTSTRVTDTEQSTTNRNENNPLSRAADSAINIARRPAKPWHADTFERTSGSRISFVPSPSAHNRQASRRYPRSGPPHQTRPAPTLSQAPPRMNASCPRNGLVHCGLQVAPNSPDRRSSAPSRKQPDPNPAATPRLGHPTPYGQHFRHPNARRSSPSRRFAVIHGRDTPHPARNGFSQHRP